MKNTKPDVWNIMGSQKMLLIITGRILGAALRTQRNCDAPLDEKDMVSSYNTTFSTT